MADYELRQSWWRATCTYFFRFSYFPFFISLTFRPWLYRLCYTSYIKFFSRLRVTPIQSNNHDKKGIFFLFFLENNLLQVSFLLGIQDSIARLGLLDRISKWYFFNHVLRLSLSFYQFEISILVGRIGFEIKLRYLC